MLENPINGFEIDPKQLRYIGQDLQRPECILAEPDGTLWSADARGGVVKIGSVGTQKLITQNIQSGFSLSSNEAEKLTKGTLGLSAALQNTVLSKCERKLRQRSTKNENSVCPPPSN
jgi:hypothetical protein